MKDITPKQSTILLYTSPDGDVKIDVFFQDETVWLTQKKIAELFGVEIHTINYHLKEIFKSKELSENSVIRKIRITAEDDKKYLTNFYNLDAIISVGYRVNSAKATQFRIWATRTLREFIIKGYVLDDERLKQGHHFGKDYFDELLEKIREIRASERRFYQKITDIYATSIEYDPDAEITKTFFATVQNKSKHLDHRVLNPVARSLRSGNPAAADLSGYSKVLDKLHWAITGKTAAEIIAEKADHKTPYMGLTTWKNAPKGKILKSDVSIGKNYLEKDQIDELNRIVTLYLEYAELQAKKQNVMRMEDWVAKLDAFLKFNEYEILTYPGKKVSTEVAKSLAEKEYEQFRVIQDRTFESDFDEATKKYLKEKQPPATSPRRRIGLLLLALVLLAGGAVFAFRNNAAFFHGRPLVPFLHAQTPNPCHENDVSGCVWVKEQTEFPNTQRQNPWQGSGAYTPPQGDWLIGIHAVDEAGNWTSEPKPLRLTVTTQTGTAACTHYVATTGNDANSGSSDAPWRTLQKAADSVVAGNVVCVKAGTYAPVQITQDANTAGAEHSGTAGAPIVFRRFGEGTVEMKVNGGGTALWIEAEYVTFENMRVTCSSTDPGSIGIFLSSPISPASSKTLTSNHITFDGVEVTNCAIGILGHSNDSVYQNMDIHHNGKVWFEDMGMYLTGARNRIAGSRIHDNASTGIQLWSSYPAASEAVVGNIIENNLIYANGYTVVKTPSGQGSDQYGRGIVFGSHAGGRDNVIRNNLIYANFPLGIDGGIGGVAMTNTHIVNNTVVGNIIGINVSGGDMGVIRNTIMANNHPAVVQQWLQANRPNLLSTVNVNRHGAGSNVNVSDGYQQDHNLIGTDPKLANFTRNDLRLTVGSPAIDAGSSQGAPPTDFEGTPRPQGAGWDIGADEYGGGGPPTCTPAAETCDQKDNDCDGEVDEGNVCQPQGAWTFCANEGGQCSFSGTKEVRYGANGAYFYKTLTNGTACTNAVFGDPAFGITKQCHYRGTVGSGDTTPPTVTLTAPAANTTVSGTVTISATASDNVGVSKIEFLVDGVVKGTDTSSPYSFSWDTTNGGAHPCNGPHTHVLSAKASDAANNIKTSSSVVVNMNNPPHCTHPDTTSPQVTAFSATPGSTRMTWGVQDTGGSHLKRIEVWRAPYEDDGNPDCDEQNKDHCAWTELTNVRVTLTSQNIDTHTIPASNPVIDDPAPGTWWYGIHAVDQAGNCTTEANKDCTTGASNGLDPQGPDKVVTSAPACTPSSWQNLGCGQGGCPQNQMRQTRTFTPSGCAADEGRCVTDSQCQPACVPSAEVCDQKDNDCDNQVDEGNVCQPAPSCPTTIPNNAFTACYFDNQDLTNFKLSRTDQKIDFTWAKGSPDPALSPDTFSSRWQGKFSFDAGSHTFSVTTDDGFRLYLDNVLILDQWRDQGATTHTVTKTLTQGQHTIKAEYYENGGDAVAKLSWQKGSQAPPAGSSDLVPQDIWWSPDPVKRGNNVTIGFRVRNNGAGTAGPFHVIIKRDGTGICDWDVPGLGAGEAFERGPGVGYGGSCSGRYGIEDAQPSGYDITFTVDDRGQVGETDEGNNERRERVTVGQ